MFFKSPENYEWYTKRCAIYCRVSTEEQVRHGYSLGAQLDELTSFAEQFCMQITGTYTDDGVSARKEVSRRKGMCQLLESAERGEIDYILFVKLDRWFRSVKEYYKVQDVLDRHNVGWKAILEDYDTTTTNGRLNLNIRLSIAQDESDRTGDRIRFVNDSRVKNGGVISGSQPYALYPRDGNLHIDANKSEVVLSLYSYYEETQSIRGCIDHIFNNFGIRFGYNTIKHMLSNTLYIGLYRGNSEYCPAIIPRGQFDRVQNILNSFRYSRERKNYYIFSGMIVCPECGWRMGSWKQHDSRCDKDYLRYRCNKRYIEKSCTCTFTPWEARIEKYLMQNVKEQMSKYLLSIKANTKAVKKPKDETAAIKRRLSRLKDLYMDELISLDDYRKDYTELTGKLEKASASLKDNPVTRFNASAINTIMKMDFRDTYESFSPQERRELWVSVIDHIVAVNKNDFRIVFL